MYPEKIHYLFVKNLWKYPKMYLIYYEHIDNKSY